MTREEIDKDLREIFADLFDIPSQDISNATSPDTLAKWDSLAHIRLIAALEEHFGLMVPPEDQVEMLNFELVGDILSENLSGGK